MPRLVLSFVALLALAPLARAQTFVPTSGTQAWNDGANWSTGSFPNAVGATADFSVPTANREVQLNVPITVGSLTGNGANAISTLFTAGSNGSLTFQATGLNDATFNWINQGRPSFFVPITLASSLQVLGPAQITMFNGPISGPGGLTLNASAGSLTLAGANTYAGVTTVTAGTLTVTNSQGLGSTAAGTVVSLAAAMDVQAVLPAGETITIAGGGELTLFGAALFTSGIGEVNGPVRLSASATVGTRSPLFGSLTLNGTISGTGTGTRNLTLSGNGQTNVNGLIDATITNVVVNSVVGTSGPVRLAAANLYTGTTTVSGLLIANNATGSATSTGAVQVNAAGTLGGNGSISGAVTALGRISPGDVTMSGAVFNSGTGRLTLGGGLTMSGGGTYAWQLGALTTAGAGTFFDQITLTAGNLTLGGTARLALDFSLLGGNGPSGGDAFWQSAHQWQIIDVNGTATNTGDTNFATLLNGTFTGGQFTTFVSDGDIFLQYTPVPEPSTMACLTAALGAALGIRRHRRAAGR